MKKVLILAVLCLFVASSAFAEGLAVGWENGLSGKLPVGSLTLQGVLGFSSTSYDNSNIDSTFNLNLAGYGALPLVEMGAGTMNAFGGIAIQTFTNNDMDLALRGGLQHDVQVTDEVSVSGKAGLQIWMDGGPDGSDNGSMTIGTWGTVGIYWHFN